MISLFLKAVFTTIITFLVVNLYAQNQENTNSNNSNNSITTLDKDTTLYIVKNQKKTLKTIANSLPAPQNLILPYEVYLKEWNDILDENELLEVGTVIKLTENAKRPKQKQVNLAVTELFPDIHIVSQPKETFKTICKEYNLKPIAGYAYYLYLRTWNSTTDTMYIDENRDLPIGMAIKLTEDASVPTQEEITKKNYKIKYVSFTQQYNRFNSLIQEQGDLSSFYEYFARVSKDIELLTLDLENEYLDSLPNTLFKHNKLIKLSLGINRFTKLSPQIEKLNNLTLFYVNDNLLMSLPEQIGKLTKLKGLYVENNNLDSLPKEISYLKELQYFNLQNNKLKFLPKEIGSLENLQSLNIANNLLAKLPKEIGDLQKLRRLVIHNNKITKLPAEIGNLYKLRELNISNNPLSKIEINKVLSLLPQLEILYLSDLGLQTLPAAVFSLRHLRKLYLINSSSNKKRANLFSAKEKQRIQKLLPTIEIVFD